MPLKALLKALKGPWTKMEANAFAMPLVGLYKAFKTRLKGFEILKKVFKPFFRFLEQKPLKGLIKQASS